MHDEIRWEKVLEIRQQLAEGTYLTQDKLEGAADRLLDAMGEER